MDEKIKQYQKLFDEKKLFDTTQPLDRAKEIISAYDNATKAGYALNGTDRMVIKTATLIETTILRNDEVKRKYPDAIGRIKQYQEMDRQGKLFETGDHVEKAKEIRDVYLAAAHQKYALTKQDMAIKFKAQVYITPNILEEIVKRIESDDIVDEDGKPVPEYGGES